MVFSSVVFVFFFLPLTLIVYLLLPSLSARNVWLLVKRQKGDCLYCHAAHRGANKYDGLLTTYTVPAQSTLEADREDGAFAALCLPALSSVISPC